MLYLNIGEQGPLSHLFWKTFPESTVFELGMLSSDMLSKLIDVVSAHWRDFFRGSIIQLILPPAQQSQPPLTTQTRRQAETRNGNNILTGATALTSKEARRPGRAASASTTSTSVNSKTITHTTITRSMIFARTSAS